MPRSWIGLLLLLLSLSACGGGGGEAAKRDADTVAVMLRSNASVQEAFQPLYACLPEDKPCYRESGPNALRVVERERKLFSETLAATDRPCLREVGDLYSDALSDYADAAQAATEGDSSTFDAAISRTTEKEISYIRKLGACGFEEGETAEITAAMRAVNIEILRLSEAYADCADEACVDEVSRDLEAKAAEGVAILEDFLRAMPEDAPSCLEPALRVRQDAFLSLQKTAVLLEEGKLRRAEEEGVRAGELDSKSQRLLADCVSSSS
jgi:hypothetical protein